MKVLIAILGCQNWCYPMLQQTIKDTYVSIIEPEIEKVFYYGQPVGIDSNEEIYIDIQEGHNTIGWKTILTFEKLLNRDFDYLFRVNASSYVHQENLLKWLENKPREKFYAGVEGSYGINFMFGSGFILSRDLVELLVTNKNSFDRTYPDDVAIGKMLGEFNIPFYNKFKHCIIEYHNGLYNIWKTNEGEVSINKDITELNKELFGDTFHFRCKDPIDRTIDVMVMKELHKLYYGK